MHLGPPSSQVASDRAPARVDCSRHRRRNPPQTSRTACSKGGHQGSEAGGQPCLSRREALAAALLALVAPRSASAAEPSPPAPSAASSILKAPGNFLRDRQRANGGAKLLAPIRASRYKLQSAEGVLRLVNVYEPDPFLYREALRLVREASLNCYTFVDEKDDSVESRLSQLQRRLKIGENCTFKIIAKNVTALLSHKDERLKETTEAELKLLVSSFEELDEFLDETWHGSTRHTEKIPEQLQYTIAATHAFEKQIELCLGLTPSNRAPTSSLEATRT